MTRRLLPMVIALTALWAPLMFMVAAPAHRPVLRDPAAGDALGAVVGACGIFAAAALLILAGACVFGLLDLFIAALTKPGAVEARTVDGEHP